MCCGVPMKETAFLLSTPLGRRWKSYSTESTTTVCPALLPPCRHDTQSGGLVEVVFSWFHTTLWAAGRDNSPSIMTLAMSRYYITPFSTCAVFWRHSMSQFLTSQHANMGEEVTTGQQLAAGGLPHVTKFTGCRYHCVEVVGSIRYTFC